MAKKKIRLIARLDVKDTNLVKGIQLEGLRKLGDPNLFAREYYEQAIDEGADCLVTGEAAHHIAILAKQKGVGLVVAGHWGTEHPVVFALADALTERLPKEVTVAPSLADVDPYSYL